MTWCGQIVVATDPVSGVSYNTVELVPMVQDGRPPIIRDPASCAVVLESGTEFSSWRQLMSMSMDDAQAIGLHIGLVWAIAWGFRAIRMAFLSPSERYDHEN